LKQTPSKGEMGRNMCKQMMETKFQEITSFLILMSAQQDIQSLQTNRVNLAARFKEEKRILLETEMHISFLCFQLKTCVLDPIDFVDTILICRNKDKPWFHLR
jgi:hypothetical protein